MRVFLNALSFSAGRCHDRFRLRVALQSVPAWQWRGTFGRKEMARLTIRCRIMGGFSEQHVNGLPALMRPAA